MWSTVLSTKDEWLIMFREIIVCSVHCMELMNTHIVTYWWWYTWLTLCFNRSFSEMTCHEVMFVYAVYVM